MSRARALALAALLAPAALGALHAETRIADIREGTNLTMALAPDGGSIVVTLLGGLWRLPITGGAATELTPTRHGADHPRFDPSGRYLVYERLVDGQWDLWLYDTQQGEARALTRTAYDERHPDFTRDGGTIVFAADRTGGFRLYRRPVAGGAPEELSSVPGEQTFPTVSEQGDVAYVNRRDGRWALRAIGAGGADLELHTSERQLAAPSWRPGGGVLLFTELAPGVPATRLNMLVVSDQRVVRTLVHGEDVFVGRPAWTSAAAYLYAADGRIWRRGIAAPRREPVQMFAAAPVETVEPAAAPARPDAPGPHAVAGFGAPAYAPDGDFGIVTALGDLWRFDGRGAERLTDDAAVELDPAVLPDGESIVYASDRGGAMNIWQLDFDDGSRRQVTFDADKAFSPVPDPGGHRVAYLATSGFSRAAESELRLALLQTRATSRVIATGLADARDLTWLEADGSPLIAVHARITPDAAAARRLVFDLEGRRVADPPPASEERDRDIEPPAIEWSPATPEAPYAVQVGRLFDGVRGTYRRHVDVHVAGGRIEAIVARGTRPLPERVIDRSDATVIPGLIDTHAHQSSLLGERLGRGWLAYGVTGVREVSADVAAAVARAESWASGRRPGPRLVIAPTPGAPALPREVPAGSPVRIEREAPLTDSLAHAVGGARRREPLPPIVVGTPDALAGLGASSSGGVPALPFSALGRSYQDVESALLASGRYVGTGLAALAAGGAAASGAGASPADGALERLWSAAERSRWAAPERREMRVEPARDTIARLVRQGARVGVGSDAPLTPYGLGLHRELELLAEAGIANDQVLRLATAQAALALGLDAELGTLEAGKLADFVVVDGDPLMRIGDARRVTDVVVGGVWHERAELLDGTGR